MARARDQISDGADSDYEEAALATFAAYVADDIRARAEELTSRWLQLLIAKLDGVEPRSIFPSEKLLNHIPLILRSLSDYVASEDEAALARKKVVDDLDLLARMRRRQGYGLSEILEEFGILAELLFDVVRNGASTYKGHVPPSVVVELVRRVHHALGEIEVITATSFGESARDDRQERAVLAARYGSLMSHEMRNRLNQMKIALEVWAGREHDEDGTADAHFEKAVRKSIDNLERLSYDLRTLVFVPSARESGWSRSLPLDSVVSSLVETSRAIAAEHGIVIIVEKPFPDLAVDASRLELILVNLIANAINYSDPYKEESAIKIRYRSLVEEKQLQIEVEDNGQGLPQARESAVEEDDYRDSDHQDMKSIGFGLALAKEASEQMGGNLWLESRFGEGTTYYFTVPVGTDDLQSDA